jgi:hypothetical protein
VKPQGTSAFDICTMNYEDIISKHSIRTSQDLSDIFWNEICHDWTEQYRKKFPQYGEITLSHYHAFAFTIDHEVEAGPETPETRVISFFGISYNHIDTKNRRRMRDYWSMKELSELIGKPYDRGHYMAHGFGGPIDVNIFPQRRDVNRPWSAEGKRYCEKERYVRNNPGTLAFSRPIYNDLTACPHQLEYGYFDKDFKLVTEIFPNR